MEKITVHTLSNLCQKWIKVLLSGVIFESQVTFKHYRILARNDKGHGWCCKETIKCNDKSYYAVVFLLLVLVFVIPFSVCDMFTSSLWICLNHILLWSEIIKEFVGSKAIPNMFHSHYEHVNSTSAMATIWILHLFVFCLFFATPLNVTMFFKKKFILLFYQGHTELI